MFVFSAASDCSGWYCTNNYVGGSNSCTNWNSSENSARNNSNLHCCHSKLLSAFRINSAAFLYVQLYTRIATDKVESSKDVGVVLSTGLGEKE